jgi:hypothetical protein
MRTSELLNAIAAYLESSNNEALLLAEGDPETLKMVAESCVEAAAILRKTADQVDVLEPAEPSAITSETVEGLAMLAGALDASGDAELKKQASVIDELLLSIAAPKNALAIRKDLLDARLVDLRKKYEGNAKMLKEIGRVDAIDKAIKESKMTDEVKIHTQPLSTRTCLDHPGAQLGRCGEHMWRCDLDGKVYNYDTGFTLNSGEKVPGGDVALQTQNSLNFSTHSIFDSREGRLQSNRS